MRIDRRTSHTLALAASVGPAIFLAICLSLVSGCGEADESIDSGAETGAVDTVAVDTETVAEDVDEIVDRLNDYWSVAAADLGFEYEPVPSSRVSNGTDGVTCDGATVAADEVEGNAFVDGGCEEGILIAYDPAYLGAGLARMEGTLSHEWGHVIQAQAVDLDFSQDPDGLPIDSELQADCFSGAWAAADADAGVASLRSDLARAGDPDDVAVDEEDAHGTGEERTIAFDLGFERGPAACISDLVDQLPG